MKIALVSADADSVAFGIRSISAYLKQAGHQTRLIFMDNHADGLPPDINEQIGHLVADSEIVGISSMARSSDKTKQLLAYLRSMDKKTVWGGIHPTLNPEECVQHADIICRGEGEGFMLDLIRHSDIGNDWADVPNAVYLSNGLVAMNKLRPLIHDLDDLPVFDYSFEDEYHLIGRRLKKVSADFLDPGTPISFTGTRGCAFNCTYCSNSRLKQLYSGNGRFVRHLSIGKYISHTKTLKDRFPQAKSFYLLDEDLFARSMDEIREFSERFPKEVGLPFECMASPVQVTEEKMDLFVKSGLWRIGVGLESGSDRTKKDIFKRPMTNSDILRAAKIINRHASVIPYYFLIIGNPYEEKQDLIETIQFLGKLPVPYFLRTYNLVFFPNTLLYEMAIADNIISGEKDCGYQLDYLAGLNTRGIEWKNKNLYLNSILYLMAGKITRRRLGVIPSFLLKPMLSEKLVHFNDRYRALPLFAIVMKRWLMHIRSRLAQNMKKFFSDPMVVYYLNTPRR